jgi:lipoic acid synthetase
MGPICTRQCRFCGVVKGRPLPPDPAEPEHVSLAAAELGLSHVVVTSVTRDDLPDGGADLFVQTIKSLRQLSPAPSVEILTPDFGGEVTSVAAVLDQRPDVFNHNVETVARLYPEVRPRADLERSLAILAKAANDYASPLVKSGLMVGLGEEKEEVEELLLQLRDAGCQMVTIGQYLRPARDRWPVARYLEPEEFDQYRDYGKKIGIDQVISGPLVRSSYLSDQAFSLVQPDRPAR